MRLHWSVSSVCVGFLAVTAGCVTDASHERQTWKEVVSEEFGFKVQMPTDPEKKKEKTPDGRDIISWNVVDGEITTGGEFTTNVEVSQTRGKETSKAVFDIARDNIIKGFKAKLRSESDFKRKGKVIGRQMEIEIPDLGIKGIVVYAIANGRAYQLNVMGQPTWAGWKQAERFLNSFEVFVVE